MTYLLKIGSISLLTVFGLNLNFCSRNSGGDGDIEAIPVQIEKGDNWSLVKKGGEILYSDEFKNEPSAVINGVFSVLEDKGYTLYLADKKPTEIKGCEELVCAGVMQDGLIPITRKDHRIELVDKNGDTKFELTPVGGHEITHCDDMFHEGLLVVSTDDNNYGYVNTSGEMVIKPVYSSATYFAEGLALVAKGTGEEKQYCVIDKKGETVFKYKKSWTPITLDFVDGYLIVRDESERILFVDKKGEAIKCPAKVKMVGEHSGKYYVFATDEVKWGVMNLETEEIVVRPKYGLITIVPGNKFLGCIDNKTELLDSKGEKIWTNDDLESAAYIDFMGIVGSDGHSYVLVDEDGKITKHAYRSIGEIYLMQDIRSDYLDMTAITDIINKIINPKGFGKYIVGNSPQSMLPGSAEDYLYDSTYEIPEASENGAIYRFTTFADFRFSIAYREYSYGYNSSSYCTWSDDNVLTGFILNLDIDRKPSKEMFNKIVDIVKDAGYRLEEKDYNDDNGYAVFTKGEYSVRIYSDNSYGQQSIRISTFKSYAFD